MLLQAGGQEGKTSSRDCNEALQTVCSTLRLQPGPLLPVGPGPSPAAPTCARSCQRCEPSGCAMSASCTPYCANRRARDSRDPGAAPLANVRQSWRRMVLPWAEPWAALREVSTTTTCNQLMEEKRRSCEVARHAAAAIRSNTKRQGGCCASGATVTCLAQAVRGSQGKSRTVGDNQPVP
jgi:hypothetical protein